MQMQKLSNLTEAQRANLEARRQRESAGEDGAQVQTEREQIAQQRLDHFINEIKRIVITNLIILSVMTPLINENREGKDLLIEAYESGNINQDFLRIVQTCLILSWIDLAQQMVKLVIALRYDKVDTPILFIVEMGLTIALYVNAGNGLEQIYTDEFLA